ncbi:apolipo protein O-domain-containing protein [Lophiotrema nucula]|uniref:MICOS complex subunit n=1 Tax=Lophiotrema nucula TaxID=690887 RepID=A0A6A5ZS98_9PLEO|nr:apolipo protein O-domain-containing protein [Lophiotrema nucula]
MAFRPLLRQRAVAPAVAAIAGTSMLFMAPRQLHAEERPLDEFNRKPIYDNEPPTSSAPSPTPGAAPSTPSSPSESYRPTPTDRLAVQIGYARLWAYKQATKAEDGVNNALTETLKLEHSFTSTIRGLAPSRESGEKVLPGGLYVLVATMAGSIITRNRNILLRASVPVAIGIGTAYAVIPVTMENVGNLVWKYEEKYPVLADTHLRAKARVQSFWETGKAHTAMSAGMLQDKVGETREKLEDWVKKGN